MPQLMQMSPEVIEAIRAMAKRMPSSDPVEWLITALGSNPWIANKMLNTNEMVEPDKPYLRQFLRPHEDVLQRQPLRPRSLSSPADLPWRQTSLPDAFEAILSDGSQGNSQASANDVGNRVQLDDILAMLQSAIIEGVRAESVGSNVTEGLVGLGEFTGSIGKDEIGPYWSAYDKWDFNSPVVNPIVGQVMKRVGTPFHVYDRFDIAPGDKNISSVNLKRRREGEQ